MKAVLLTGLQGSGKSSFYKERFFSRYVRISLDLLRTRHRERMLLDVCLSTDQPFVVDNTNLTRAERSRYHSAARARACQVVGYYFQSKIEDCLKRNAERSAIERVPDAAILSASKKLEIPSLSEGYSQLYYVRMQGEEFIVEDWRNEI